jgi:hypothetical protein
MYGVFVCNIPTGETKNNKLIYLEHLFFSLSQKKCVATVRAVELIGHIALLLLDMFEHALGSTQSLNREIS